MLDLIRGQPDASSYLPIVHTLSCASKNVSLQRGQSHFRRGRPSDPSRRGAGHMDHKAVDTAAMTHQGESYGGPALSDILQGPGIAQNDLCHSFGFE